LTEPSTKAIVHPITISAPAQLKHKPTSITALVPSSLRSKKESTSKEVASKVVSHVSLIQASLNEKNVVEVKSKKESKHLEDFMKDVTDIFE
jgi:hypothetical protein